MTGLRGRRRPPDPFGALGLIARPDLTDDDVRAAWRRVAAATHPDRQDGGDPERFATAAAAYTELRTRFGRGEALAEAAPGRRRASLHRGRAGTGRDGTATGHGAGRTADGTGRGRAVAGHDAGGTAGRTGRGRAVAGHDPGGTAGRTGRGRAGPGSGASAPGGRALASEGSVAAGFSLRLRVAAARLAARVRRGRPARLALRVLAAAAASTAAVAVAGAQPAGPALVTGAVTWLVLTARQDLAPPAG